MEHFFALLTKSLSHSPKHGWVLFLSGGAMIALMRSSVLAENEIGTGWKAAIYGASVIGVVILIVYYTDIIAGKIKRARSLSKKAASDREYLIRAIDEGVNNLEVLDDIEISGLIWILAEKGRRFSDSELAASSCRGLIAKKIVFPDPSTTALYVWQVNSRIWEKRDEILRNVPKDDIPPSSPWRNYW